ncbi:hypothetical protein [Variovorax sp. 54]|uniref:hypothetical protein n=1 Tax=Variovorax sp. 54 TaxID=2035212 RepID=UPI00117DBBC3|nr:hypothetical protein [Variovorax sp. 54]
MTHRRSSTIRSSVVDSESARCAPKPCKSRSREAGPALAPPQKRFNILIRQIEKAHQTLAAWHEGIGTYRQAHAQVLLPMEDELLAARCSPGTPRSTSTPSSSR